MFVECSCINSTLLNTTATFNTDPTPGYDPSDNSWGWAMPGSCPVDCSHQFYIFLGVVCLMKFSGATGRASNFLVSVR